jgi:hypothetical protein
MCIGYHSAWELMDLPEIITLDDFLQKTKDICALSMDELEELNDNLGKSVKHKKLWNSCFLAVYSITMLIEGFGFGYDTQIHFVDTIDGFKVSAHSLISVTGFII